MFIPNHKYQKLNLFGQHLVIAANPNPPMFYGGYNRQTREYNATHGIDVTFINTMAQHFNFSWSLADQHGEWGMEPTENGTYDGLLGSVISGNATFGIGAVSIRLGIGKESLIDFTTPNLATRVTFLTLESPRVPLSGVLLMPFNYVNWSIVVSLLLLMILAGRLCSIVSKSHMDFDWLVLGSFLQKAPRLPDNSGVAVQALIQLSWFAGLILLAAYGGILISFLTRSFKFGNIDSLRQFTRHVKRQEITPLLVRTSTFVYDFKRYVNTSETLEIILDNMEEVETYREGFLKITRERIFRPDRHYALIGQYMIMKKWADHLGKKYFHLTDQVDACIFTDSYGLVFRHGSNLTLHFDRFIRIGTEAGFFVKWSNQQYRWTTLKGEIRENLTNFSNNLDYDTDANSFSYDQLELRHLWEHFYLLFMGAIVGASCMTIEIGFKFWMTH